MSDVCLLLISWQARSSRLAWGRRIQPERPLPGPNTRSRMQEAPRDGLLVGLSCARLPLAGFATSVLLSEASFLAWSAALLITRLSHRWRYCLDAILPLTPSHPRQASSHFWVQFSLQSVQSLSRVRLFATPRIAARQASLSITNSRSSLRLASIESVMPSSHLILGRPLLLLPPIPPSIKVFSNESARPMS